VVVVIQKHQSRRRSMGQRRSRLCMGAFRSLLSDGPELSSAAARWLTGWLDRTKTTATLHPSEVDDIAAAER
jgi:hypothetical protein